MSIILPNNILNGQVIDAIPVMANFNALAANTPSAWPVDPANGGIAGPNPQGGSLLAMTLRNLIDNGAMNVAQRYGASVQSGAAQFTLDRWQCYNTTTSRVTSQQIASTIPGFPNKLRMTVTSAGSPTASDFYGMTQVLENLTIAPLNFGTAAATPLTVSFWVQSSITGTFPVVLRNAVPNRSYVTTFTVAAANVPQRFVIQIPGDTAGTWPGWGASVPGMALLFMPGAGATNQTSTLNAWQSGNFIGWTGQTQLTNTAGATFDITGVQLEVGTEATAFENLPFDYELRRAQRFLPGFVSGSSADDFGTALIGATNSGLATLMFPTRNIRVAPTGFAFTGASSANNFGVQTAGALAALNSVIFNNAGVNSGRLNFTQAGTTWPPGQAAIFYGTSIGVGFVFTGAEI